MFPEKSSIVQLSKEKELKVTCRTSAVKTNGPCRTGYPFGMDVSQPLLMP